MSNVLGVSPNFFVVFSLKFDVCFTFYEYQNSIICIYDNLENMLCIEINLKPILYSRALSK